MGINKKHTQWNLTNVWEVSARQSIRDPESCVVVITPRHSPTNSGGGSGRIQWEDIESLVTGKIKGVYCVSVTNIYVLTDWSLHIRDGLNTEYGILRTSEDMCSLGTPGLLKTLLRIYTRDAKGFVEESQSAKQFQCKPKYAQNGKGEERGYIAWRSRVF